ncbi:plastocyanin [Amycolatopsis lexingtonensis]|uniref:Plastocyanin n=1 Tax=Amycolatopsis lexingtonensis TaxID=218822 RepID=A0ABR9HUB7_9PSEU|nr:hypothetical protein [Amycolatopsis lexingtonensis]MBE1494517.1 plastocyanin [Amycolatopsis lexingtonensis]
MARTLVLVTMLTLVLGGCASPAPPAPAGEQVARFTVQGGKRVAGPDRVEVSPGRAVRLEVTSDTADELHVHGYDKEVELTAGQRGSVSFTADVPGLFEVELHHSGAKLTQLRVGA